MSYNVNSQLKDFKTKAVFRISADLHVKSPEPESADGTEEKRGCGDLNGEGPHHTQLLPPHGQLVGEPGQGGGDTLGLIVVRQRCVEHTVTQQQKKKKGQRDVLPTCLQTSEPVARHKHAPVRPHHVGQRDVSFTTPEANMSLKSNQRISQKVTRSCSLTPRDPLITVSGATRMQRKPVSRSKLSLDRSRKTLHG